MTFKKDMKVRIRRDSQYSHQSKDVGRITRGPYRVSGDSHDWYDVIFPRSSNAYRTKDLEIAEPISNDEGITLLPRYVEYY